MSGERPGHTLQTTALVNETYLRLVNSEETQLGRPDAFLRRLRADDAPDSGGLDPFAAGAEARRGRSGALDLDSEALAAVNQPGIDLVALDDALNALSAIDARKGRVVELRFFGGLSVKEAAEVLGISAETVHRDWKMAKSWLRRELSGARPRGA